MLEQIEWLIEQIQGSKEKLPLEHRVLNMAIAMIGLIITAFFIIYLVSSDAWHLLVLFGVSSIFFSFYYIYSRFITAYTPLLYWLFIASTLVLGITGWMLTGGWKGSTPITGTMALVIFIAISSKRYNILITFLTTGLLITLFAIEYYYPDLAVPYPASEIHFWDVVLSTLASVLIVGVVVDTLQKSHDKEKEMVEEKNLALREALNKLESTQQQLIQAEKMAGLGTMAAGIAHEINNPINFVYAGSQALEDQLDDLQEEMQKRITEAYKQNNLPAPRFQSLSDKEDMLLLIQSMRTGAERVAKLVRLLSQLSHYREQKTAKTQILSVLEEAIQDISHPYKGRILLKESNKVEDIYCYPVQLKQAFMHLFINALESLASEEGKVEVFVASTPKEVAIYIQDNGCGIPANIQNQVFNPFFTTKDVGEGMGLGLSLTYDIILYHQGRITISSQEEVGTTVVIFLPKDQQP